LARDHLLAQGSTPSRVGWRLPAREIEDRVAAAVREMLDDQASVLEAAQKTDIDSAKSTGYSTQHARQRSRQAIRQPPHTSGVSRTRGGGADRGHIVVPTAAIRDEGTSYHYLAPAREVAPTPRVLKAIEAVPRENSHDYVRGKTWTTDAVYRETRPRMARRQREGCVVVEVEAAAFSRLHASAASSSRKSCMAAIASPARDGIPVGGTVTRCASGFFISPPRPAFGCKPRSGSSVHRVRWRLQAQTAARRLDVARRPA
jgi:hypothetical protein